MNYYVSGYNQPCQVEEINLTHSSLTDNIQDNGQNKQVCYSCGGQAGYQATYQHGTANNASCVYELSKCFNTLRPGQNGHQFTDIFKCIFMNEKVWLFIPILLKFVPRVPIDNKSALVQIMAWCRSGNKPLSEPMMVYLTDTYMRHSASMSQPLSGWISFTKTWNTLAVFLFSIIFQYLDGLGISNPSSWKKRTYICPAKRLTPLSRVPQVCRGKPDHHLCR